MEKFEPRNLLAADLDVFVEPFTLESPGQEVTRVLRVSNNGDEDAVDAVVRSLLSDQLDNATWERTAGLADFIHRDSPKSTRLQTIIAPEFTFNTPRVIGDINADGLSDYFVPSRRDSDHFIVFGREGTARLSDIPQTNGEYDSPTGVFVRGDRYTRVTNLGDINGDSLDDFALNNTIIFGSPTVGTTGPITLSDPGNAGFLLSASNLTSRAVIGSGDVNGDGFDDLLLGNKLVLGSETIGDLGVVTLDTDTSREQIIELPFREWVAHNAGDVNNDGFDDFGFGLQLVLGGPEFVQVGKELTWAELKPTIPNVFDFDSHPINAGDVNGDGIDDLLYWMRGTVADTTASGKGSTYVPNGINLVFGSPTIVDSGVIDVESDGITIQLATNHERRATPRIEDANRDGISDIALSSSGQELIVFGGAALTNIDFGFQDLHRFDSLSDVYDGQNGFATSTIPAPDLYDSIQFDGESTLFIDGDFRNEIIHIWELDVAELWTPPSTSTASGSDDILDQVTIPAGESVIYTVRGTLKDDALPIIHSTAVSSPITETAFEISGPSHDAVSTPLAKNVDLEADVAYTSLEVGKQATFELRIDNHGPAPASSVAIVESITASLDEAEWSLNTTRLYPDDVAQWPTIVPSISGFSVNPALDQDFVYWGRYPELGQDIGLVGDVNDDGFEDFSVSDTIYFGGENFGINAFAESEPRLRRPIHAEVDERVAPTEGYLLQDDGTRISLLQESAEAIAVGDLNLDGHRDFLVLNRNRSSFLHVVLGDANLNEPVDLEAHPVVAGLPPSFTIPYAVEPTVDLDGDGVLDAVFGVHSYDHDAGVYTIRGGSQLNPQQQIVATNLPIANSNFADSFDHDVTTGDFNDDAHTDLVITHKAGLTIYFGGTDTAEIPPLNIESDGNSDPVFGPSSRSISFDVNGDGADDLLVGHPADAPHVEFRDAGSVSVLLGRRATDLSGQGEIDQLFDIAPGEQLTLRISGTVTEETLNQELTFELVNRDDQHEMNPFNNEQSVDPTDRLFADINRNGTIDFADLLILGANFGRETDNLFDGDLNGDRRIDFADFLLLSKVFAEAVP